MALFGRRRKNDLSEEELLGLDEQDPGSAKPEPAEGEPGLDRPWDREGDGPYDISEWTDLDGRFDLGALRIPVARGTQMRLDVEQPSGRAIGATLSFGASHVQLQLFAAPRTEGIWDELRPEIARGLVDAGGAAEIADGVMGKEIRARMPGRAPDGRVSFQPARFIGIDGPRWFLRVVINGPAATDDAQLRGILPVVRNTVVTRGDEPRPPREVLSLTPPQEFVEAMAKEAEARKAKAQQERDAQVARASTRTQMLRTGDATRVSGIGRQAAGGAGAASADAAQAVSEATEVPAPRPAPEPEPTDAPKAPTNPDFT